MYFSRDVDGVSGPAGPGAFYRTVEDRRRGDAPTGSRLTTTITCLESLLEMPAWHPDPSVEPQVLLNRMEAFMNAHLKSKAVAEIWKSDEAAYVYCRVRTLGSYLRLSERLDRAGSVVKKALVARAAEAWHSHYTDGASFGLREATEDVSTKAFRHAIPTEKSDRQYPPNAYLTYWGLLMRRGLERAGVGDDALVGDLSPENDRAAHEWLTGNLARQLAFHFNKSPLADAQQLLWSICGLVRFTDGAELDNVRSPEHELLVAGLRAFFEQMTDAGDWAIGAPLFHYPNAGNAYSYIYEALGELFSLACASKSHVEARAAEALRRELRAHWPRIRTMFSRANALGQRLENDNVVVWSSGHHPHRSAESWATASVFRFLQSLRRVVGMWCSEETKEALNARKPRYEESDLHKKGDTWDTGKGSVGLYLRLAFLWPLERQLAREPSTPAERLFDLDPDQPIAARDDQARSAILFGPPGTGKTTVVEALAGALEWSFIEITPALFINEGMDLVSARADHIFQQLMEIDRCVVLLDEIDELIQLRGSDSDPIERFFTTTMLPRLAALWSLGRVLFFVNTNNIERVDAAIRRAQRFDAALFVLPPSYRAKARELKERGIGLSIPKESVDAAVEATKDHSTAPSADRVNPGWLALMRYDQIGTFADVVKQQSRGRRSLRLATESALRLVAQELMQLDWLETEKSKAIDPSDGDAMATAMSEAVLPLPLGRMLGAERRDARRRLVWKIAPPTGITVRYVEVPTGTSNPEEWARRDNTYEVDAATGWLLPSAPT